MKSKFSNNLVASAFAIISANDSGVVNKISGILKSCFFFFKYESSEVLFSILHLIFNSLTIFLRFSSSEVFIDRKGET